MDTTVDVTSIDVTIGLSVAVGDVDSVAVAVNVDEEERSVDDGVAATLPWDRAQAARKKGITTRSSFLIDMPHKFRQIMSLETSG